MESFGYLVDVLIWGIPVAALLAGSLIAVLVVRWRRKAIEALGRAENDA
ncbi:hypothetical protein ACFYYN_43120 [Streptomyces sp. NPDC001902]